MPTHQLAYNVGSPDGGAGTGGRAPPPTPLTKSPTQSSLGSSYRFDITRPTASTLARSVPPKNIQKFYQRKPKNWNFSARTHELFGIPERWQKTSGGLVSGEDGGRKRRFVASSSPPRGRGERNSCPVSRREYFLSLGTKFRNRAVGQQMGADTTSSRSVVGSSSCNPFVDVEQMQNRPGPGGRSRREKYVDASSGSSYTQAASSPHPGAAAQASIHHLSGLHQPYGGLLAGSQSCFDLYLPDLGDCIFLSQPPLPLRAAIGGDCPTVSTAKSSPRAGAPSSSVLDEECGEQDYHGSSQPNSSLPNLASRTPAAVQVHPRTTPEHDALLEIAAADLHTAGTAASGDHVDRRAGLFLARTKMEEIFVEPSTTLENGEQREQEKNTESTSLFPRSPTQEFLRTPELIGGSCQQSVLSLDDVAEEIANTALYLSNKSGPRLCELLPTFKEAGLSSGSESVRPAGGGPEGALEAVAGKVGDFLASQLSERDREDVVRGLERPPSQARKLQLQLFFLAETLSQNSESSARLYQALLDIVSESLLGGGAASSDGRAGGHIDSLSSSREFSSRGASSGDWELKSSLSSHSDELRVTAQEEEEEESVLSSEGADVVSEGPPSVENCAPELMIKPQRISAASGGYPESTLQSSSAGSLTRSPDRDHRDRVAPNVQKPFSVYNEEVTAAPVRVAAPRSTGMVALTAVPRNSIADPSPKSSGAYVPHSPLKTTTPRFGQRAVVSPPLTGRGATTAPGDVDNTSAGPRIINRVILGSYPQRTENSCGRAVPDVNRVLVANTPAAGTGCSSPMPAEQRVPSSSRIPPGAVHLSSAGVESRFRSFTPPSYNPHTACYSPPPMRNIRLGSCMASVGASPGDRRGGAPPASYHAGVGSTTKNSSSPPPPSREAAPAMSTPIRARGRSQPVVSLSMRAQLMLPPMLQLPPLKKMLSPRGAGGVAQSSSVMTTTGARPQKAPLPGGLPGGQGQSCDGVNRNVSPVWRGHQNTRYNFSVPQGGLGLAG